MVRRCVYFDIRVFGFLSCRRRENTACWCIHTMKAFSLLGERVRGSHAALLFYCCTTMLMLLCPVYTVSAQDNCTVGDIDVARIPMHSFSTDIIMPPATSTPQRVIMNISLCAPNVVPPAPITWCSPLPADGNGSGPARGVSPSYIVIYHDGTNGTDSCVVAAFDALVDVTINTSSESRSFVMHFAQGQDAPGAGGNTTVFAQVTVGCGGADETPVPVGVPSIAVLNTSSNESSWQLTLALNSSAVCATPTTTTVIETTSDAPVVSPTGTVPWSTRFETASPAATTSEVPSNTAPPAHEMLSSLSFWLLVFVTIAAYYVALLVSSLAVGESTNTLLMPLRLIKTLALSTYDCVCFAIGSKRPVGYAGLDFDDEDDDIPNQPSGGVNEH